MKDIAEQLELHESTISRTVNGKYLLFAGQVYELRQFFTHSLPQDDDVQVTSQQVKAMLQQIVAVENRQKPLSDSKIEVALKLQGFDISRRTVGKYREALGIANVSERKRKTKVYF